MKKPRISVYTTCRDAIDNEFTLFEGLIQALKFCDEFVYVDGGSVDGTLEYMNMLMKRFPQIRAYRYNECFDDTRLYAEMKNKALECCTGDWVFLMDADEVYDDYLVSQLLENNNFNENVKFLKFNTIHVYGYYYLQCYKDPVKGHTYYTSRVYGFQKGLCKHGQWKDNPDELVRIDTGKSVDLNVTEGLHLPFNVCHYGHLRSNEVYLQRKNLIEKRFDKNWKDLDNWDFSRIVSKNSECFSLLPYCMHPQIMHQRFIYTLDVDGQVNREKFLGLYKSWLENLCKEGEYNE